MTKRVDYCFLHLDYHSERIRDIIWQKSLGLQKQKDQLNLRFVNQIDVLFAEDHADIFENLVFAGSVLE